MAAGDVRLKLPPASTGVWPVGAGAWRQDIGRRPDRRPGHANSRRRPDDRRRLAYDERRAAGSPVVGVGARVIVSHDAPACRRVPQLGCPAVLGATGMLGHGRSRHYRHRAPHNSPNHQCPHTFLLRTGNARYCIMWCLVISPQDPAIDRPGPRKSAATSSRY